VTVLPRSGVQNVDQVSDQYLTWLHEETEREKEVAEHGAEFLNVLKRSRNSHKVCSSI
jgi:hypothetical protein